MGKTTRASSAGAWVGKVLNWDCLFVHRKEGFFLSVYVDDIKMAGQKQNVAPTWKKFDEKRGYCTNQHHFLTMYTWDVFSVNANRMRQLLNNIRRCLSHVFLLEQPRNTRMAKTSRTNCSVVS